MAICPFATWRPLPEAASAPKITPRAVILHSAVSDASSLYGYFSRSDVVLESHFYVDENGAIEQYIDTSRMADANYEANSFAISIETWDDRDPDRTPWTDKQRTALVRLIRWLCDTHGIPRQRISSPTGAGIGYHTMWGAPSQWTPVSKGCPGAARIPQFPELVAAVAAAEEEDDMPTPADLWLHPLEIPEDRRRPGDPTHVTAEQMLGHANRNALDAMDAAKAAAEAAQAAIGAVRALWDEVFTLPTLDQSTTEQAPARAVLTFANRAAFAAVAAADQASAKLDQVLAKLNEEAQA